MRRSPPARTLLGLLLCSIFLLFAQPARAGQFVVIDSTDPALAPGQVVAAGKTVAVAAGATATLIADDGALVTLSGPFSGIPNAAGGAAGSQGLADALARLVSPGDASTQKMGAIRSFAGRTPPDIWLVDVTRTGGHCVISGAPVTLWREKAKSKADLTIKPLPNGERQKITWAAGANTLALPGGIAVEDGTKLLVRGVGKSASKVTFHAVPANLKTDAHRALWMAENGCRGQALALLASLGK